jgi:hypothetical protein
LGTVGDWGKRKGRGGKRKGHTKKEKMVGNSKKTAENIKYKYKRNFINYLKNTYHIKLT